MLGHVMLSFNFFEDRIVSPTSFLSTKVPISHEIEMDDVWCCTNPPMFNWVSSAAPNLDYAKVEFAAPIPPSIPGEEPSDFDLSIKLGSGSSVGAHSQNVLYEDPIIWHHLMMKKDLLP